MPVTMDHIELFDAGFGPHMISVTPPGGSPISPTSDLSKKMMGKAPGRWTGTAWVGAKTNNPKHRCPDWKTAETWKNWGAGVGFVVGDGYAVIDNDQGEEFSDVLSDVCFEMGIDPVRRYVDCPTHKRDAFFFRVLDFIGEGALVANRNLSFRNGNVVANIQILGRGLQAVIYGLHKDTHCPYVWNRKIAGPQEIPVISVEDYDEIIRKFVGGVNLRGWTLEGPLPQSVRQSVNSPPNSQAANQPVDNRDPSAVIADAKELLDLIPNRVVPAGEKENSVDKWLNIYENWRNVPYKLAGELGPSVRMTPEAEALWLEWVNNRHQEQDTQGMWRSVIRQPDIRCQSLALTRLVRELGVMPKEGFPPVPPNDPAFKAAPTPTWDRIRERWALFHKGGFLDTKTGEIVSRETFCHRNEVDLQALTFELRPGHKGKLPDFAKLFCGQADYQIAGGKTYAPGDDLWPVNPKDAAAPLFNVWRAPSAFPVMLDPAQVQPWLDHVGFITGSDKERDLFVKWLAFVVQCPRLKPNWHYLITSVQGIGKDTMMTPVKLAVGKDNSRDETIHQFESDFNDLLETKLLVIGEVSQPRWDSHGFAAKLKKVLAAPPEFFWINQKNEKRYPAPNRTAVVMFSNDIHPLMLEPGQRRVYVINRRDAKPEPAAYYLKLNDWLENGGSELVASYLHHLPLTAAEKAHFQGGVAPESEAKTELEQMSLKPGLDALGEIIQDSRDGTGPFPRLLATAAQLAGEIEQKGLKRPLPQEMHGWLMDMERRKQGVRRLRVDPKKPHQCGTVGGGPQGVSARLWALADHHPDGADWKDFTDAEKLAQWRNAPPPPKAKILDFPKVKPSEDIV